MERKGKYLYSRPGDKGLVMTFEYRGKQYDVIRAFTYPISEGQQHREEQERIDDKIALEEKFAKNEADDLAKGIKRESAREALKGFFDLIDGKEEQQ